MSNSIVSLFAIIPIIISFYFLYLAIKLATLGIKALECYIKEKEGR